MTSVRSLRKAVRTAGIVTAAGLVCRGSRQRAGPGARRLGRVQRGVRRVCKAGRSGRRACDRATRRAGSSRSMRTASAIGSAGRRRMRAGSITGPRSRRRSPRSRSCSCVTAACSRWTIRSRATFPSCDRCTTASARWTTSRSGCCSRILPASRIPPGPTARGGPWEPFEPTRWEQLVAMMPYQQLAFRAGLPVRLQQSRLHLPRPRDRGAHRRSVGRVRPEEHLDAAWPDAELRRQLAVPPGRPAGRELHRPRRQWARPHRAEPARSSIRVSRSPTAGGMHRSAIS